jgi:hypothetical protein
MRRPGRFLVLCLLLVLLPLRSLLAAGQLGCEPPPVQQQHAGHEHHEQQGSEHDHAAKPCKLCAPCCLAAAPPPVLTLDAAPAAPAARAALAPAEAWASVVPPLPDPPPRA